MCGGVTEVVSAAEPGSSVHWTYPGLAPTWPRDVALTAVCLGADGTVSGGCGSERNLERLRPFAPNETCELNETQIQST